MSSCGVAGGPPDAEVYHTLPPSDALLLGVFTSFPGGRKPPCLWWGSRGPGGRTAEPGLAALGDGQTDMRRRPRDTLLGRGHVSLLLIPRPVPRGPPTDQQLPASRDPLSPPHRLESAWRCLPWLRPLPGPWWFNGSLLLGQQICKPQVSSISLGKKKRRKKRKLSYKMLSLSS